MQKRTQGAIAAAAAVAIALTSLATVPADAAARKHHVTRHYSRGGNAAAFGMFAATLGTIATLAARDRYYGGYYGPRYYAPYPYYGPYYGPYPYR